MKRNTLTGVLELLVGVLFVVLGIIALTMPGKTLTTFVMIYGIGAIVIGIAEIIFFFRLNNRAGYAPTLSLLSGILGIITGILLLTNVTVGVWVITILFPIWFIVNCFTNLIGANFARLVSKGYYWFYIIVNIIGIVVGFMLMFNPIDSSLTISAMLAWFLVMIGVSAAVRGIGWIANRE